MSARWIEGRDVRASALVRVFHWLDSAPPPRTRSIHLSEEEESELRFVAMASFLRSLFIQLDCAQVMRRDHSAYGRMLCRSHGP